MRIRNTLWVPTLSALLAGMLSLSGCSGGGSQSGVADDSARVSAAAHSTNLFELDYVTDVQGDADVADDPAKDGEDWSTVYAGTSNAIAAIFKRDFVGSAENSFFTGGGSKDERDVSEWQWEDSNDVVPDKDDIAHAFAAAYEDPITGHTIFYFGADRYDTSGDAQIGFWFFRKPVTLGTKPAFNGEHSVGDILVLADYRNGGSVGEVHVYQWIGGQKPLQLLKGATEADCAFAAVDDPVCAVINNTPGETPPWQYMNKSGETSYRVGALFEGGIDINALLGVDNIGCYSTFLAETRSSHSTSAQLKDFALGAFPLCDIKVTKTGEPLSKVGDEVSYTVTVENPGRATLYAKEIKDTLIGDIILNGVVQNNPFITANTCGQSLPAGAFCTINYAYTVAAGKVDLDDNGNTILPNTASVIYTEFDNFTGISFNKSNSHTVNLFEPSIDFTKSVSPTTILQGESALYTLTLSNLSSADTPSLACTIDDPDLGIVDWQRTLTNAPAIISKSKIFMYPENDPSCKALSDGTFECFNLASVSCELPEPYPNILPGSDSATVIVIPSSVDLVVAKEGDAYSKVGDDVQYTITIYNNNPNFPVTLTSITDDILGDLQDPEVFDSSTCGTILEKESSCIITATRTTLVGDADPLVNVVTVVGEDAFGHSDSKTATHSVDLVHPSFTIAKSCASAEPVPAGATANFRIRIENTGDVELLLNVSDPELTPAIDLTNVPFGIRPATGCTEEEFDNAAGIWDALDGCFQIEGGVIASGESISNTVTATATLPVTFGLDNVIPGEDTGVCEVGVDYATRTQGFWKTHGSDDAELGFGYTCHILESEYHLNGSLNLGWKQVNSCGDLFAIFWANKAKDSTGVKRDQVCMTQIQGSRQLAAALLNGSLDNGAPLDPLLVSNMRAALASGDRQLINKFAGKLTEYNESYDDTAIIDLDGALIPHADPNGARSAANYPFVDCNVAATRK